MNTLIDTDEGKAKPSVWPVYVAAAIVLLVSLQVLARLVKPMLADILIEYFGDVVRWSWVPYATYGFFGVVTTWGLVRPRPWVWWCVVVWSIVFVVAGGAVILYVFFVAGYPPETPAEATGIALLMSLTCAGWVGATAFLTWVLATRRRLFFPPKPADEE